MPTQMERFTRLHRKYFGTAPKGPILEYGSGAGAFLREGIDSDLIVHGVEVDPQREVQFVHACGSKLSKYRDFYHLYDGGILPFESGYFEGIYSWFVLEHVSDIWTSLREIVRTLKPGGTMALFTQDARDCYEGHMGMPWPPYLPKTFIPAYLRALGTSESQIEFMVNEVHYVTTPQICTTLESLGCEVVFHSETPDRMLLDSINIASEADAIAYAETAIKHRDSGAWHKPRENSIIFARRLEDPQLIKRTKPVEIPKSQPNLSRTASVIKKETSSAPKGNKTPTFEEVERARRNFRDAVSAYEGAGKRYLDPAPVLSRDLVEKCRILGNRYEILDLMPKGKIVAEVGTDKGDFAKQIIERTNPSKLHVLDLDLNRLHRPNIQAELDAGQVELHAGDSSTNLEAFDDQYFDWIYIDGDHRYEGVKKDIDAAVRKVKKNGFLIFNDYTVWSPQSMMHCGVARAVNELCIRDGWEMVYFCFQSMMYNDVVIKRRT